MRRARGLSVVFRDLETLHNPLSGLGGQTTAREHAALFLEMRHCFVQEPQVLEIALAPYADQVVKAHFQSCAEGKRLVE